MSKGTYKKKDPVVRFWSNVDKTGDCWLWLLAKDKDGYGRIKIDGRHVLAHRFIYKETYGSLDDDKVVRHICNTPACVNPAHLKEGTQLENMQDKARTSQTLICAAYMLLVSIANKKDSA